MKKDDTKEKIKPIKNQKKKYRSKGEMVKVNSNNKVIQGWVKDVEGGYLFKDRETDHFLRFQSSKGGNAEIMFDEEIAMNLYHDFIENKIGRRFITKGDIAYEHYTLPSVSEFASHMGILEIKLIEWRKLSDKLDNACLNIMQLQKNELSSGAVSGRLKENMSKFLLNVNHGMTESQKIENSHEVIGINIIPPENRTKIIDVTTGEYD